MALHRDNGEINFDFVIPSHILDDLCCRFIINVPSQEKKDLVRICFQIEQAHWFYLDFYSNKFNDTLRPCSLKEFTRNVFYHIRYLRPFIKDLNAIIDDWKEYKYSVPTFGAIILDEESKNVLLVKSYWSKSSWGFPKGKINKDETPCHCATREVFEETGFNISSLIHPDVFVEANINEQRIRLYIVSGVSQNNKFNPQTRNEIKEIKWFPVNDIPIKKTKVKNKLCNIFYMVIPFMRDLRKWILQNGVRTISKQRFKSFSEVEDLLHTTSVESSDYSNITDGKSDSSPPQNNNLLQQNSSCNPDNEVECYEGSDEDDIKFNNEEIYGIPRVKLSSFSGKELNSYVLTDISFSNYYCQNNGRTKNNLDASNFNSLEKDEFFQLFSFENKNNYFPSKPTYNLKQSLPQDFNVTVDQNINKLSSCILTNENTSMEHQKPKNVDFSISPLKTVKLKGKSKVSSVQNAPSYSYDSSNGNDGSKIIADLFNELTNFQRYENEQNTKFNELIPQNDVTLTNDLIQSVSQNKAIQAMKCFKFNKRALYNALES